MQNIATAIYKPRDTNPGDPIRVVSNSETPCIARHPRAHAFLAELSDTETWDAVRVAADSEASVAAGASVVRAEDSVASDVIFGYTETGDAVWVAADSEAARAAGTSVVSIGPGGVRR